MAKKEIKVVLTKAGTAYDSKKAYKLHDYILIDDVTMYICKRVDASTMTCVGHDLDDTEYWDKCIDMKDALTKVNEATEKAYGTYSNPPYVDSDGYYYRWNVDTNTYDKTDVNLTGKPFSIKRVFPSIAAMNAVDASTFEENDFILINTSNVEDEDNAKLYVVAKNAQGKKFYSYLVDTSGFRGFTGKTPQFSIGTVTTIGSGEKASAAISADGTDSNGNPKYKLNLSIPKGDKLVFADLTAEEITLLQKPATDAATKADAATVKAIAATTNAEKVNATITDNTLVVTDRNGTQKSISLAEQAATKTTLDQHGKRLDVLEQAVGDLGGSTENYYYASQDTSKASPDLVNPQTNASVQMLQDMYRPFLIDHSDNDREEMIGYELKRNNWLRYKDNSFAPAVGITEEQRAACDVELYLDAEHTQKYCDAGSYDAEKFYDEYGLTQKLYDADGNEIAHILRPWETTSKNYSIKVGDPSGNYLIDGYSTNDGEGDVMYKGILKAFREVAGIKARYLAPTLLSPCQDTSIKDTDGRIKFRSFFFLYNAGNDGNTIGCSGGNGGNMFKKANRCYPRVNDVNQISSMTYARNNNVDASKTYPFAEAGFHAYNTFLIAHELLYGTNYINDPDNLFSSGVSSNNGVGNEAQWQKYGGVRIKMGDDGDCKYLNWNSTPNWIYKDANKTLIGANMTSWLNNEYPKWQEMEAQIALSFASELGIAENTEFEVYGHNYWYVTPPKAKGINDGYMNARVYRKSEDDWQGYDANGNVVTYHIEAILRQGVMDGLTTAGDIFHYRGGGYEQVATNHCEKASVQSCVNDMDFYVQTDQKKWHTEKSTAKNSLGVFDFEKTYERVGHVDKIMSGWAKKRVANANNVMLSGAGVNTYACCYGVNDNWYSSTLDQRVRTAVAVGGYAIWHACASRCLTADRDCSYAYRYYGGSAQCLFEAASQGAARPKPLQAE